MSTLSIAGIAEPKRKVNADKKEHFVGVSLSNDTIKALATAFSDGDVRPSILGRAIMNYAIKKYNEEHPEA